MSLITWSNNGLTHSVPNAHTTALSTIGKKSGKFYFEFTGYSNIAMLGIGRHTGSSYMLSDQPIFIFPYDGSLYGSIGQNVKYTNKPLQSTPIGVAFDLDSGTIFYIINGVRFANVDIPILKSASSLSYPAFSSGGSPAATVTANFGATEFSISKSNPELWRSLVKDGYLPYDVDNAKWFRTLELLIKTDKGVCTLFQDQLLFLDNKNIIRDQFNDFGMTTLKKYLNSITNICYEMKQYVAQNNTKIFKKNINKKTVISKKVEVI